MAAVDHGPTPRVLGITGPIACGKTTVGTMLLELGALERIDADEVVHELMDADKETIGQITAVFGTSILTEGGTVDRTRLGSQVFADQIALKRLENIVHPAVRQRIRSRLRALQGRHGVIVIDAVKLLQSDLLQLCEAVWVVRCEADMEMERLVSIRGMSEPDARNRISAQPTFEDSRVTAVIDNSGSVNDLRQRVVSEWERFGAG